MSLVAVRRLRNEFTQVKNNLVRRSPPTQRVHTSEKLFLCVVRRLRDEFTQVKINLGGELLSHHEMWQYHHR